MGQGTGKYHNNQFPNEDASYRAARDELLAAETALRKQIEAVAEMRRGLPPGGMAEDYEFESPAGPVKLSGLFEDGKDSLVIYSYMFAPEAESPCPMCTSLLDSLDGQTGHITRRINFAVVAKSPIEKVQKFAADRGWTDLKFLSSLNNSYNVDYFAENENGQWPMINVFQKTPDGVRHTWGSELFLTPPDDGLHNRHADLIWPLWAMFDLTPGGRGTDWYPALSYD